MNTQLCQFKNLLCAIIATMQTWPATRARHNALQLEHYQPSRTASSCIFISRYFSGELIESLQHIHTLKCFANVLRVLGFGVICQSLCGKESGATTFGTYEILLSKTLTGCCARFA